MKREILFRGKRVDNGEWVYGDLITDGKNSPNKDLAWIFPEDAEEYSFDLLIQVSKETVGQYTGIKDKNGKDIYEGDIVETPAGQIATVDYSENHYQGFICNEVSTDWHWNLNILTVEVIGNIFESPEMLEQ